MNKKTKLMQHGIKIEEDGDKVASQRTGEKVYQDLGFARARKQSYRE